MKINVKKVQNQLTSDTKAKMGDDSFCWKGGTVGHCATKGTHWLAIVSGEYLDSNGCPPPDFLTVFSVKRSIELFL